MSRVRCNRIVSPPPPHSDLCGGNADCGRNASCVRPSGSAGPARCACDKFYVGDGYQCRPGPDAGCDVTRDCHRDANCALDPDTFRFECRCRAGFLGDGLRGGLGCRREVIGCNIIDDCGEYAECRFDRAEGGYRCSCDERSRL